MNGGLNIMLLCWMKRSQPRNPQILLSHSREVYGYIMDIYYGYIMDILWIYYGYIMDIYGHPILQETAGTSKVPIPEVCFVVDVKTIRSERSTWWLSARTEDSNLVAWKSCCSMQTLKFQVFVCSFVVCIGYIPPHAFSFERVVLCNKKKQPAYIFRCRSAPVIFIVFLLWKWAKQSQTGTPKFDTVLPLVLDSSLICFKQLSQIVLLNKNVHLGSDMI